MAIFEIDGKEVELQGIESDSIVIARPTKHLEKEDLLDFARAINRLNGAFKQHHCTLISANFDDVTFEVIQAKVIDA